MAVGTLVSFAIQAVVMLCMLDRRIGGLDLRRSLRPVMKMVLATGVMTAACLLVRKSPIYPAATGRAGWAAQLALIMAVGAGRTWRRAGAGGGYDEAALAGEEGEGG